MPYGVPTFNLDSFPANEARVDRLEVAVAIGTMRGSDAEVAAFVRQVQLSFPDDEGRTCRLLNRPRRPPRHNKWVWNIAKRVSARERRPLFSGNVTLARVFVDGEARVGHWTITCNLILNPTRWLRYQPVLWSDGHGHLTTRDSVDLFSWECEESSEQVLVDDTDNVILGSHARMDMADPQLWPTQLRRYLMAVVDLFDGWLAFSAGQRRSLAIQRVPLRFTLSSVEVYWEQGQSNPVELLRHWEPPLRRYAAQSTTTYRRLAPGRNSPAPRDDDLLMGRYGSSPCYSMPVARGADFKVYAKTDQRLRFEVTYDTRRASRVFPRITADTVEELCALIDIGTEDARQRVLMVGRTFAGQTLRPYAPPPREPYQLILDIAFRLGDEAIVRRIVADLVLQGRLENGSDPRVRNAIRALKRAGILQPGARRGRSYVHFVTEPYRLGLDALRHSNENLHAHRPLQGDPPPPLEVPSYLPPGMTPTGWRIRRFRQRPGPYVPVEQP